jgi:hypothetical protein
VERGFSDTYGGDPGEVETAVQYGEEGDRCDDSSRVVAPGG